MPPISPLLFRHKLPATFDGPTVTHITRSSNLAARQRLISVRTVWTTETRLGAGAFGVVWRQRSDSGQLRAVKIISRDRLNVQEVEALIDLQDHPELFILFSGWFEDVARDSIHLAMEYIAHGDLGKYIAEQRALDAREITSQILEGLVVLHERKICHRDLKPQNILIASLSPIWVKISDFGIAKRWAGTALKTHCGTPIYSAPEQLGMLPHHFRSAHAGYTNKIDIWALGVIVHELLTRQIPFLDTFAGGYADLTLPTADGTEQAVDTALLHEYCRGADAFPCAGMRNAGAVEEAVEFVKCLMAVDPGARDSAVVALASPWIQMESPQETPRKEKESEEVVGLEVQRVPAVDKKTLQPDSDCEKKVHESECEDKVQEAVEAPSACQAAKPYEMVQVNSQTSAAKQLEPVHVEVSSLRRRESTKQAAQASPSMSERYSGALETESTETANPIGRIEVDVRRRGSIPTTKPSRQDSQPAETRPPHMTQAPPGPRLYGEMQYLPSRSNTTSRRRGYDEAEDTYELTTAALPRSAYEARYVPSGYHTGPPPSVDGGLYEEVQSGRRAPQEAEPDTGYRRRTQDDESDRWEIQTQEAGDGRPWNDHENYYTGDVSYSHRAASPAYDVDRRAYAWDDQCSPHGGDEYVRSRSPPGRDPGPPHSYYRARWSPEVPAAVETAEKEEKEESPRWRQWVDGLKVGLRKTGRK